jgi:hypothetical protein
MAVLISSFWFHRPPDGLALAGMALIAAAGMALARGARVPRPALVPSPRESTARP